MEMDLPRTQLSLLLGYAKARFAAALRTLTGGRRDKSPVRSSKGRSCPSGSTFTAPLTGAQEQELHTQILLHRNSRFAMYLHWTVQLFGY